MVIFPLAPDQTIAQTWSNGARGSGTRHWPRQLSAIFEQLDHCYWLVRSS